MEGNRYVDILIVLPSQVSSNQRNRGKSKNMGCLNKRKHASTFEKRCRRPHVLKPLTNLKRSTRQLAEGVGGSLVPIHRVPMQPKGCVFTADS